MSNEASGTRLLPREEILHTWGHGWIEDWHIGDDEEPEEIELLECVWIRGEIVTATGRKRSAEDDYWVRNYNRPYGVRLWEEVEKPTDEQRKAVDWNG